MGIDLPLSWLLAVMLLPGTGVQADGGRAQPAFVRGGTFRMGTAASAIAELKDRYDIRFARAFENEAPDRMVTVADFRIDRYEVTNAEFARFVESMPEWRKERLPAGRHNGHYLEHWQDGGHAPALAAHPVVFVTWDAAVAFCSWAGGRLPTEAEWEYAARAGDDREFPWGNQPPSPDRVNAAASRVGTTTPVGRYPANEFGLFDLAGNVWEFTADPAPGGRRGVRGGSFGAAPVNLRTRWRDTHVELNAVEFVGFRCAYPAGAGERPVEEPSVALPPELARVLTDYEVAWRARDAAALARLFADDGFVLPNGAPPVRGRAAIERHYAGSGGPLALRAFTFAVDGALGYIIGGFARQAGNPTWESSR